MSRFLSSDTHFGHKNILSYCPARSKYWGSVEEMNMGLVERWNSVVGPDDEVLHLGDVAMGNRNDTLKYVHMLNGRKVLFCGNHDNCSYLGGKTEKLQEWRNLYLQAGFAEIYDYPIKLVLGDPYGEWMEVLLNHLPYEGDSGEEDRYNKHRPIDEGVPMLCGHIHDKWKLTKTSKGTPQLNVGVDVWDFYPVREDVLLRMLKGGE